MRGTFKWTSALVLMISAAGVFAQQQARMSVPEYIATFRNAAMEEMKTFKIPASITLGQGILESSSGNSRLAMEGNNHFGIKCKKGWTGKTIIEDDDEVGECFRAYDNPFESYRDHSLFLIGNKRYSLLFSFAPTDYLGWTAGLKAAGYATNPQYDQILSGIIQKYRLGMFDTMVLFGEDFYARQQPEAPIVENGLPAIISKPGESAEDIAERFNLPRNKLLRYNDLPSDAVINPGDILYLRPKRNKATVSSHTVEPGESVYGISQKYGIKLKQLYKKNHLKPGQEIKPGEVISLQKKSGHTPALLENTQIQNSNPEPVAATPLDREAGIHTVKPGETLYSISRLHGISVDSLKHWNNLSSASISPGQVLLLTGQISDAQDPLDEDTRKTLNTIKQFNATYHIVLKGETLFSIARLYGITTEELKTMNTLSSDNLSIGQKLMVRTFTIVTDTAILDEEGLYTVKKGDTLYSIAKQFGVSTEDLKNWNRLESYSISIDQKLKVKP